MLLCELYKQIRFATLANLAQLVERHPRNVQVVGSIPIVGSLEYLNNFPAQLYRARLVIGQIVGSVLIVSSVLTNNFITAIVIKNLVENFLT